MKLAGKTVVITGGAMGIGNAIATLFALEGANVAIGDIDLAKGQTVVDEINNNGGKAIFVTTDVGKSAEVANLMDLAEEAFGKIDIVVNNAGIAVTMPFEAITDDIWDKFIDINLKGVIYGCRYGIQKMKKNGGGVILNLGSIHSHVALPLISPYVTTKGAVLMLTKALAVEYAQQNIRVNALCPAYIKTPMIIDALESFGEAGQQMVEQLTAMHPIGRIGEPEEMAKVALFLVSSDSSYITGAGILADGGYTSM